MHWWEETEARAHRVRTPQTLSQTLLQRLIAIGIDANVAAVPAYDLAALYFLS